MTRSTAADDLILGLTRVVDLPGLTAAAGAPLGADDIAAVIGEADRFCTEVLAPGWQSADREAAHYANGRVTVPAQYHATMKAWIESGWQGVAAPEAHGGQGLPHAIWTAVNELASAADMAFFLGPILTAGAIDCLDRFGTEDQKARWLPKLVTGEWPGTMNLTEPQAGSDLGAIRTRAEPLGNGRYAIHGQKIYITWGEHETTDNILHLILARLPDAPAGSRGISLFAAQRILDDGTPNALRCGGIEKKMGIHASPTCVMLFEGAEAEMVGEPGRGLNAMFAMMNAARLAVGVQGVGQGARALQLAEAYAEQRVQGGRPIAQHPDVARMLNEMRAITLAGRLLALEAAAALDRHHLLHDEAAATRLALLIPIVKSWCSDRGVDVASLGIQVHGGMGFVEDTGAAQVLRDARIAPIYEGTNGIQAIDLLVRKVAKDDGAAMRALLAEVAATPGLAAAASRLQDATATMLALQARDADAAQSLAVPYLEACGWTLGGWMLVRAAAAAPDRAPLAAFYLARLLPRATARCLEIEAAHAGMASVTAPAAA
ncbi:acyl-CoA dehydrogenase [Falsiroseomonas bella]|uniref:Acyl-CoA dehydrogenase n=1 Tax=Falsiroseomonas bella TaxID=2184016 RepID=A0A317FIR2_9PROT|nr:acyl-CoA dehydrogenase family protein [Falsiroseomonas bella]PWS38503.1 acyl-CoA dehydrogenase [Falsiroseomonas bella]